MDCNLIKIFINLEIIGEEDKNNKYIYIYLFFFNLKKFLQFGEPLGATTASKPNFYYTVYDYVIFDSFFCKFFFKSKKKKAKNDLKKKKKLFTKR